MITDDLERLRTAIVGCELMMYADTSTNTILASDCAVRLGQEHLDALCEKARAVFAVAPEETILCLCKATGRRLFLRSAPGEAEVLCGVFDLTADLGAALTLAQDMLAQREVRA